jgi:hypothetical protein
LAPIEPPHPKRILQTIDAVIRDLQTLRAADPENATLSETENIASALRMSLSTYADSYVPKNA